MIACMDNPSSENTVRLSREAAAAISADRDPEAPYVVAPDLLFCGQKDLALGMVKTSIDGHFCAYYGLAERFRMGEAAGHAAVRGAACGGEEVSG